MAERIKQVKAFDGYINIFQHQAESTQCQMTFGVYLPPQAESGEALPVIYWLSGLTCTHENFLNKAGAFRKAAELGVVLVVPDTSPRNTGTPGEDDEWDFGTGASFYVNALQAPWNKHYHMYDYIVNELPEVVAEVCPIDNRRKAVSGHSMGGHGALVVGLNNPESYRSISAFAPMASPMHCPWGEKAMTRYLGEDKTLWQPYDGAYLLGNNNKVPPVKVDQGDADGFLEDQLKPQLLTQAADANNAPLELNMRPGYDHSYFFIATFIDDHLAFHAEYLFSG